MIQVFCNKRGSGKTKRLIQLANDSMEGARGDSVFIDKDYKNIRQVNRKIRFISTKDLNVKDCNSFYGMLCGIISANYDIENIYIDGLLNIVSCTIEETSYLFKRINTLCERYNLNLYLNVNCDQLEEIPDFIKRLVA